MREGLKIRARLVLVLLACSALAVAQDVVYYLNGVPYVFPAAQGGADQILTNDGVGSLSWSDAPSAEGIVSGMIVLSTVACPVGWTRVSAADDRVLRGSATYGTTGGLDTHSHSMTGVLSAQSVALSGDTGGSAVSLSGSTETTSISHGHDLTKPTVGIIVDVDDADITSITANAANPSHSHGLGSLAGASHTHDESGLSTGSHGHSVGSLATSSANSLPAYSTIIACEKD